MKTTAVSILLFLFAAVNLNAQDQTIVIQTGTEDQKPPLLEEYAYVDLQLNVGLTEADFNPKQLGQ